MDGAELSMGPVMTGLNIFVVAVPSMTPSNPPEEGGCDGRVVAVFVGRFDVAAVLELLVIVLGVDRRYGFRTAGAVVVVVGL